MAEVVFAKFCLIHAIDFIIHLSQAHAGAGVKQMALKIIQSQVVTQQSKVKEEKKWEAVI